jgi:hypothetical protein
MSIISSSTTTLMAHPMVTHGFEADDSGDVPIARLA